MSLRLRFAVEVEFDSPETAKAFGVALGWTITGAIDTALDLSEATAPACVRGPFEVTPAEAVGHG